MSLRAEPGPINPSPITFAAQRTRRLLPIYLVVFIGFVGYSLMITVFTPMILSPGSLWLGAGDSTSRRALVLGILLSLYPAGQFLGSPVLGALSDRFGREPVLLTSLIVTSASYAFVMTALEVRSLTMLMIASVVGGFSEANIVIAQSAIADVSDKSDRSRLFGYVYLSVSLAFVLGPLVGGKLADPATVSWFNDATPFGAVLGLLIVTLLWTALTFEETHPREARTPVSLFDAFSNLLGVFTARDLRLIYLVNTLFYVAIYGFFRSYPMYLVDEYKLGVSRESEFIAWVAVPIIIANAGLTGWLSKRYSPRTIARWSGALSGLFMLTIVVPRPLNALWITLFLTALPIAVCLPSCAAMLSMAVGEESQGRAMGNNQSLQVGAEAVSAVLAGFLASFIIKLPLLVLALLAIATSLLLGVLP